MGFERKRKVYKLRFADPSLDGLVVRCRGGSMYEYMELAPLVDADERDRDEAVRLFELVADLIIDWNVTDDGEPVAPDVDGLMGCDPELVWSVVFAWLDAAAGVPDPLEQPSAGGDRSVEESLTMEPLSASHAS